MISSLPEAFKIKHFIPEEFLVPDELKYEYMIHVICKTYGLSKTVGSRHTESDFWKLLGFENLDGAKEDYLINNNKNQTRTG